MKITTTAIIIYLLFCLPSLVKAQQKLDTIFYDRDWKETTIKDKVQYYRIATKLNANYEVKDFYLNNILQMEGYFSSLDSSMKEGYFKYYYDNGSISSEGLYKNNKEEGTWKYYNLNNIWRIENYKKGELDGDLEMYYDNGKIKRIDNYEMGKVVSGDCFTKEGKDTTYFSYEIEPEFMGGEEKMNEYLANHVEYPRKARRKSIEGRVIVRFFVEVNGTITNTEILSNTDPLLNKSAVTALKKMPKWSPGKIDGIPVRVSYVLPFHFKLDE